VCIIREKKNLPLLVLDSSWYYFGPPLLVVVATRTSHTHTYRSMHCVDLLFSNTFPSISSLSARILSDSRAEQSPARAIIAVVVVVVCAGRSWSTIHAVNLVGRGVVVSCSYAVAVLVQVALVIIPSARSAAIVARCPRAAAGRSDRSEPPAGRRTGSRGG